MITIILIEIYIKMCTFNSQYYAIRYVTGNELLVSGKHIFNHFNDCKDSNTYLCPELINSIITLDVVKVCRIKIIIIPFSLEMLIFKYNFRCKV